MSEELGEKRSEVAWAAICQFQATLKKCYKKDLDGEKVYDNALVEMLNQHQEHLNLHVEEQKDVDPYKIVCWYGCMLLKTLPVSESSNSSVPCISKIVADAMVDTLNGFLYDDSTCNFYLNKVQRNFLSRMLMMEKKNRTDHGIWQNGLYSSFYTALAIVKQVASRS